ncbi:gliding motility protein GldM [Sphingobacteriales bacterium UPWRP_1]|nr:hypothetical protein B6N25_11715 [Sphingobacteriales bacterium TSM_CSS]PSJ72620.1 gliding motility protein GldM [Sphingobacteriales bacterium UPWRP_1]
MSIPKEPRQQMINIMYLVLTALLALNVSAEILNAFRLLKKGIDNSNASIQQKIEGTMKSFQEKVAKENRGQEYLAAAEQARKLSADFSAYLDGLDQKLVDAVGIDPEKGDLKRADDQDTPTRLFVDEGLGSELEQKINEYRDAYVKLFKDPKDQQDIAGAMPLKLDSIPANSNKKDWKTYMFFQMPAQAVRTLLSKFKNDNISTEAIIVSRLHDKVGEVTIIYDKFQPAVIPNSTYLLQGEKFEAKIYLAASSSMARPTISVGGRVLPLDANGMATYTATASGTGKQSISGNITATSTTGKKESFNFTQEYTVATRPDHVPVVSADKMNVFYIGVENPITASITGIRDDQVSVNISGGGGTARKSSGPGQYVVTVTTPGKANVNLSGKSKDGSPVNGSKEFRVKYIPDPIPELGGKSGGALKTGEMKAQVGMAAILKDFDFDARFTVEGFEMTLAERGQDLMTCNNSGSKFGGQCQGLIDRAKVGSIYYFDNIKAKGPDGRSRKLPSISFKII